MVEQYIMASPSYIKDYVFKLFSKKGKLSANGVEFIMPSIFIPNDWKKHFSINIETGLWQDFKTGRSGNFIQFIAAVEEIPYNKAEAKVLFHEFEHGPYEEALPEVVESPLERPEELVPVNIHSHDSSDPYVKKGWVFLYERKLFDLTNEDDEPFYISTQGKYKNRLIIPFKYDNEMFYFQGRALEWETPKYLNPTGTFVKPSHILYPFSYEEDYVIVCEGPLDAISLQRQGVNATATMGSRISQTQAQTLQEFGGKIIVGYDNDEAGERGMKKFEELRKTKLIPEFSVCLPPSSVKDWNEAHILDINLNSWIDRNTFTYNYEYTTMRGLNSL